MELNDKDAAEARIENDPLVGSQETTDSVTEAVRTPQREMVLETPPMGPAVKSRKVAGFLGVFLGGLGMHRFYLGYPRVGTVQLVLTAGSFIVALVVSKMTGSTPGGAFNVAIGAAALGMLWGLFEGFAIFVGGLVKDGQGRPLRK